ncbi:hypothetical protein [Euzebya sp.]|uniref:hypothetical protein n=1 Tax=Euzebya sp. TaxID=1971409 RepID=UPI0035138CF8
MSRPTGVVPERRARRLALAQALMAALAVVLPGAIAIVLVPENPTEGYVAVALGTAVVGWQAHRARTAGFVVDEVGVHRMGVGGRRVAWADLEGLAWRRTTIPTSARGPQVTFRLVARTADGEVPLMRTAASAAQRAAIDTRLAELGLEPGPDVD